MLCCLCRLCFCCYERKGAVERLFKLFYAGTCSVNVLPTLFFGVKRIQFFIIEIALQVRG